jgi:hypothetical protein
MKVSATSFYGIERSHRGVLTLVLAVLFLAGCGSVRSLVAYKGDTIEQSKRIMINKSGQDSGQYSTSDLTVTYKYIIGGNKFHISGSVQLAPGLIGNYGNLNDFYLGLLLGDNEGTVLRDHGLTTFAGGPVGAPINFSVTVSLPPQAVCMAFAYSGEASGDKNAEYYFSGYPIVR